MTTTSIHPLARHGTTQRERLLKALIPENLRLDDRNLADLLAFVGKYAEQIRFWSPQDTPDGDWTAFFEKDASTLLAIVAATDLEDLRLRYRNDELRFVQACKAEKQREAKSQCEQAVAHLYRLVEHIFGLAQLLLDICQKLPANHPLKAEMQALIREKLGVKTNTKGDKDFDAPIAWLVAYQKVSHNKLNHDGTLIDLYAPFFNPTPCAQAWGILTPHDFNCIDYKEIEPTDRETLWRLFLAFYKVLSWIVTKAEKAFQSALNGRRDHPPHIALLLSFLMLFRRYHQAEMNAMVGRHLLFYYQDVLRLQYRREIPDHVHIVFEIAQNIDVYRLQKDTLLLGGQDALGLDRLYALTDEVVFNKAKLVEKQSLYFDKENNTIIALPAADRKDGLKVLYAKDHQRWHPLSGKALYQKWQKQVFVLKSKMNLKVPRLSGEGFRERFDILKQQLNAITANPGLIISSPELWLTNGGNRTITVVFESDKPIDLAQFYTEISTAEGIHTFPLDFNTKKIPVVLAVAIPQFHLISVYEHNGGTTIWQLQLPADFAAIAPPKDAQFDLGNGQPFIRLRLKDSADYEGFESISLSSVAIQSKNSGLRNLSLQLGSTPYAPASEIPLIGSTADKTKLMLYATTAELSVKNISKAKLALPFKDTFDHDTPDGIRMGNSMVEKDFIASKSISIESFTNPLIYSPTSPYPFFKKEIVIQKGPANAPINIYKIPPESISISYESDGSIFPFNHNNQQENKVPLNLYWVDFLSGYSAVQRQAGATFALLPPRTLPDFDTPIAIAEKTPTFERQPVRRKRKAASRVPLADGNLRLAFENLQAGQTLSLLFHFAEGTGNPDHIAPDEIVWSYLRQNQWVRIPPQFITLDETLGLRQTGIVRLQIPLDINSGNTRAIGQDGRKDLFWLQATASESPEENIFVDALPMLIDIFPQAATAVFQNRQNDIAHLDEGLPAQTISQLRFRDANVTKVEQPFGSFGGRMSEQNDLPAYYRRIHERLRHRQRAITLWDYERLTLEQFPEVALVKCLTHTRDTDVTRSGYVTLGVVPHPDQMMGPLKYFPIFNAGVLEAIEQYLNRHNSYFVSGQGGGVVCCCDSDDDGCGCGCSGGGRLLVRNAIFEPVRLQVCVKFRKGKDAFYYTKQLNEDLKIFLAPWATDTQAPLLFGAKIYTVELLRFLENLDYIDVVMGLKVKHFPNREMAETVEYMLDFEVVEVIEPFTSRSVLTTYLDVLNEENPNVIDHAIELVEGQGCCDGCTN